MEQDQLVRGQEQVGAGAVVAAEAGWAEIVREQAREEIVSAQAAEQK